MICRYAGWVKFRHFNAAAWLLLSLHEAPARDELTLIGLAEIRGVKLAYVRLETSRQNLDLVQNESTSGILLLDSNTREGWARLQQGAEQFVVTLSGGTISASAGVAKGQIASADYVGGLRAYVKSLPAGEREPFQNELNRLQATPAVVEKTIVAISETAAVTNLTASTTAQGTSDSAAEARGLDAEETRQLADLILTLAPPPGSRQGTADEIAQLRRLRIAQNDPAVRARILQELRAYAAPTD